MIILVLNEFKISLVKNGVSTILGSVLISDLIWSFYHLIAIGVIHSLEILPFLVAIGSWIHKRSFYHFGSGGILDPENGVSTESVAFGFSIHRMEF